MVHSTKKKIEVKKLLKYRIPLGRKIFLIGTPEHTNLGDSAIEIAQESFLMQCGIPKKRIKEITFNEFRNNSAFFQKCISNKDAIFQLGGGNMGDQWFNEELFRRKVIADFPANQMIIFPQTIYYTPTSQGEDEKLKSISCYNSKNNLTLIAREQLSYAIMQQLYPDTQVFLSPDIVLSATIETFDVTPQIRTGVLMCMRNDAERSLEKEDQRQIESLVSSLGLSYRVTDMHSAHPITKFNRRSSVKQKMEEFLQAELVITDRLHGMIFAAITGTPCIVLSNYNHKISGTYAWISYLPYIKFVHSVDEIETILPGALKSDSCVYDKTPLDPHFNTLAKVVKEKWHK